MAKFKDSTPQVDVLGPDSLMPPGPGAAPAPEPDLRDRSIGDILAELRNLSAEQVEKVLQHQRSKGVRFGEAAVALGLASRDDVLYALAQQFHYPYAPDEQKKVSAELVMLREPFGPRAEAFRALRSRFVPDAHPDPWTVLGVAPGTDRDEVRRVWRQLVREYHPDRMIARGVPAEAIKLAEKKLRDINRAWEEIAAVRVH